MGSEMCIRDSCGGSEAVGISLQNVGKCRRSGVPLSEIPDWDSSVDSARESDIPEPCCRAEPTSLSGKPDSDCREKQASHCQCGVSRAAQVLRWGPLARFPMRPHARASLQALLLSILFVGLPAGGRADSTPEPDEDDPRWCTTCHREQKYSKVEPVSYTHLTLPTIYSV